MDRNSTLYMPVIVLIGGMGFVLSETVKQNGQSWNQPPVQAAPQQQSEQPFRDSTGVMYWLIHPVKTQTLPQRPQYSAFTADADGTIRAVGQSPRTPAQMQRSTAAWTDSNQKSAAYWSPPLPVQQASLEIDPWNPPPFNPDPKNIADVYRNAQIFAYRQFGVGEAAQPQRARFIAEYIQKAQENEINRTKPVLYPVSSR